MTLLDWTYAPAPESSAIAAIKDRYLPYIDGTFVEGGGPDLDTVSPGTAEQLSTVSTVDAADLDRAVKAARRAYEQVWSPMSGAERGKYLFRIARGIAERARELAVVETLDNGKPIKETRDFDVPTAAQHFFYHAGWADKLRSPGSRPGAAAAGGGRPGHPLELPAADGGLEDRPGPGRRQHRGDQAGRDHPTVGAGAGRDHRRRRACRPAWSTS